MPGTVLLFVPHPDDAEIYAGGTLVNYVTAGARAVIVVASDGRRGSFEQDSQDLAHTRREEMNRAAAVMGAEPPVLLEHPDLEIDTLPPGLLREQFIRLIRLHRPEVVIAEDPSARYQIHPDHRAVAWAASDAIHFSSLPLMHPEHLDQGLQPHYVLEKYFFGAEESEANRVVDITESMEKKLAALSEHSSQVKFLVQDVTNQARLAGLALQGLLGEALSDPMAAMRWAMEAQAARVGAKIGVKYGEAFRYMRFHPFIESLLAGG